MCLFHCWHETGRVVVKETVEDHGKFGKERHIVELIERKCCKCLKIQLWDKWKDFMLVQV